MIQLKQLQQQITTDLKSFQFEYNRRFSRFERKRNDCLQIFELVVIGKTSHLKIIPQVRIKIATIEDIYHKYNDKAPEFYDATTTIGNSLGHIINYFTNNDEIGNPAVLSYLVENEDDVDILSNVIPTRFQEYALRYFDENSSVHRVHELLNSNPTSMSIHNRLYPIRACIGLIPAVRRLLNPL